MKAWIVSLLIGLSCLATTAYARPNVSCSAADDGWEEHFSGHRTCDECLNKHGKCVETCRLEYYTCEATGIDSLGASFTVKGSGDDRWEAERNALAHCDRNFRNCSAGSCNSKSEDVSKRRCEPRRPDPRPEPRPEPRPDKPEPRPDRPDRPEPRPDKPQPRPDKPEPKPEKPQPKPEKPEPKPEKPQPKPEKPEPKPEKPQPKPDKPEPKPEKPNPEKPPVKKPRNTIDGGR